MFHVHLSCISNMKNIKGNIQPKEVSVVNTELSLKVKRVMLMIFSIDFVWYKCNTFILRCFLQFTCTNLDGCQKGGGNFLNLLQKEGVPRKGGFPQKRGTSNSGGNYELIQVHIRMSVDGTNNYITLFMINYLNKSRFQITFFVNLKISSWLIS